MKAALGRLAEAAQGLACRHLKSRRFTLGGRSYPYFSSRVSWVPDAWPKANVVPAGLLAAHSEIEHKRMLGSSPRMKCCARPAIVCAH